MLGLPASFLVYYFAVAAVENYKLGDLKQQKFVLLLFWKSKVQDQSLSRATPPESQPLLSLEGRLCSLTLPVSGGRQHSLACGCIGPRPASSNLSLVCLHIKCPLWVLRSHSVSLLYGPM